MLKAENMVEKEKDFLVEVASKRLVEGERNPESYVRSYWRWKKNRSVIDLFSKAVESRNGIIKIADMGCGLGHKIFFLDDIFRKDKQMKLIFYGVDLDPLEISFCNFKKERYRKNDINFIVGDIMELRFPDNEFDVIISTEVLEHLEQPVIAVKEFHRILKPGGVAIITTPNKGNLMVKWKKLFKKIFSIKSSPDRVEDSRVSICKERVGHDHISIKSIDEWVKLFQEYFIIEKIKRGAILSGSQKQDRNRILFALLLLLEIFLEKLAILKNLSEDVIISMKKPDLNYK